MKKALNVIVSSISLLLLVQCGVDKGRGIKPKKLQCESRTNPLGIDETRPELSWQLVSNQRNKKQSAYRILVASSLTKLQKEQGDLWDSKKVSSDSSCFVEYKGKQLDSKDECYWKVKVWDEEGNPSDWSKPAKWTIGLLDRKDWQASWIGTESKEHYQVKTEYSIEGEVKKTRLPARYLRNEFKSKKKIKNAYAYVSGLGLYELYLNGKKVSDHVLSPAQTQFNKRVLYNTFDITDYLKSGKNAIGVILGNGRYMPMRKEEPIDVAFFGFPKLLLHIDIEYQDSSHKTITSNQEWQVTNKGPIVENNEYDGEIYDARKMMKGWSTPGFSTDDKWSKADKMPEPEGQLFAQVTEPIRITQTIKPHSINQIAQDTFIVDMGQNMVGWAEINVDGEKGKRISLRFAEDLKDNGRLYMANLRSAEANDIYICNGKEKNSSSWEPKFTYHGFRYIEVVGYPGELTKKHITGKVVHDDLRKTGQFSCSSEMINKVYRNAVWGIRGNYRSFPTDCPQRDEKMAWLGDRATGSRGESYIFDHKKLYEKWLQDIDDAQLENGSVSDVSPAYWKFYNDNVTWDGAHIILTDMLYDQYGDKEVIKKYYDFHKKWYLYMTNNYMDDGIMPRDNYGDWCVPPKKPEIIHTSDIDRLTVGNYLGTAFFYYQTKLMRKFARLLDKDQDHNYFDTKAQKIRTAFNDRYFNKGDMSYTNNYFNKNKVSYSNNTATANILALALGLVDKEYEDDIFNNLVQKIEVQHNGHMPAGVVGIQFLMRTLTEFGRSDIAHRLATQTDYPSWGYMVKQGATTIWELWNGNTANPAMNSRNHVMLLGDFIIWLYEDLAGIKPDQNAAGFKHTIMRPHLIEGLDHVRAQHNSPYGEIASNWRLKNGKFDWEINIPVNIHASVYIPTPETKSIMVNGDSYQEVRGVEYLHKKDGYSIFRVGSGKYRITTNSPKIVKNLEGLRLSPPNIEPKDTSAFGPVNLKITARDEAAEIYYTINGDIPTPSSRPYTGKIIIDQPAEIRARSFINNKQPSYIRHASIDIYNPSVNGLNYGYYEEKWSNSPPNIENKNPVKIGKTNNISNVYKIIKDYEDGLIHYSGFLKIDREGEYFFNLMPRSLTWLKINDNLILNDRLVHQKSNAQESIYLEKGFHPLEIIFLGKGRKNTKSIKFMYRAPGIPRKIVPISKFFFDKNFPEKSD
jgi:alpha-L-rhamnosidase